MKVSGAGLFSLESTASTTQMCTSESRVEGCECCRLGNLPPQFSLAGVHFLFFQKERLKVRTVGDYKWVGEPRIAGFLQVSRCVGKL